MDNAWWVSTGYTGIGLYRQEHQGQANTPVSIEIVRVPTPRNNPLREFLSGFDLGLYPNLIKKDY